MRAGIEAVDWKRRRASGCGRGTVTKGTAAVLLFLAVLASCGGATDPVDQVLLDRATRFVGETILIDTHIDLPYRLRMNPEDVADRTSRGDFDYPRAIEGGLDVAFCAVYVPGELQEEGGAREVADELIDLVESIAVTHPDKFFLLSSVQEATDLTGTGRVGLALGMENGTGIEGDLALLSHFYNRGVRYVTLAHSRSNRICDSSYDEDRRWHGLSPFGREVVSEMNRLGMMIDVSHVTDETFEQILDLSAAPVIASHSSCRHFTPGWERNMSDGMIRRLASLGGVIQINFGSAFVDDDNRRHEERTRDDIDHYLTENGIEKGSDAAKAYRREYRKSHRTRTVPLSAVADQFDHVVGLVGIEHVGLGSDFDGLGDGLPEGLGDVSRYPHLIAELMRRGYSDGDLRKICSGNLLRVWAEVERVAQEAQRAEVH